MLWSVFFFSVLTASLAFITSFGLFLTIRFFGGVAIGATCDFASHTQAAIIGVIAGIISTIGFALLQEKQQKFHKIIDTCGVSNLHGIPGIFGGLAAIFVVKDIAINAQLKGILITVVIAILAGLLSGKIISLFGKTKEIYDDVAEFNEAG